MPELLFRYWPHTAEHVKPTRLGAIYVHNHRLLIQKLRHRTIICNSNKYVQIERRHFGANGPKLLCCGSSIFVLQGSSIIMLQGSMWFKHFCVSRLKHYYASRLNVVQALLCFKAQGNTEIMVVVKALLCFKAQWFKHYMLQGSR